MVGYQVNDNFALQLNGYNLSDKYYYRELLLHPAEARTMSFPAPGRTVPADGSL